MPDSSHSPWMPLRQTAYSPVPNCYIQMQSFLTWTIKQQWSYDLLLLIFFILSLSFPFITLSYPFTTLNHSQISYLNYIFPIGPSFNTPVFKFDISDTAKWMTLALHSITGMVSLVLLDLGNALPLALQHPFQGSVRLSPFSRNPSCTLVTSRCPWQNCL